jgi:hypothetical protein
MTYAIIAYALSIVLWAVYLIVLAVRIRRARRGH